MFELTKFNPKKKHNLATYFLRHGFYRILFCLQYFGAFTVFMYLSHFRLTYRTGYRHSHLWLALGNLFGFQLWHERKLTCMHRRAFLRCKNIVHMRFAIPFCGQCTWQSSLKIVRVLATRYSCSSFVHTFLVSPYLLGLCGFAESLDDWITVAFTHPNILFIMVMGIFMKSVMIFVITNKWNPLKPQKPNPIRIILKIEQKFAT